MIDLFWYIKSITFGGKFGYFISILLASFTIYHSLNNINISAYDQVNIYSYRLHEIIKKSRLINTKEFQTSTIKKIDVNEISRIGKTEKIDSSTHLNEKNKKFIIENINLLKVLDLRIF